MRTLLRLIHHEFRQNRNSFHVNYSQLREMKQKFLLVLQVLYI